MAIPSMIFRSLDSNGDWNAGQGLSSFATGQEAVNLNVATELNSWARDCFFALQDGVDWRNLLQVGKQSALILAITAKIQACYGIVSVVAGSVSVKTNTRGALITYTANSIYTQGYTTQVQVLAGGSN